jgi:ATP-binding cassette subfamily D (ALD) long-chain fatty acid import protein
MVSGDKAGPKVDLNNPKGIVIETDYVEFSNVPIVSPNGDVLVASLSFKTEPGNN